MNEFEFPTAKIKTAGIDELKDLVDVMEEGPLRLSGAGTGIVGHSSNGSLIKNFGTGRPETTVQLHGVAIWDEFPDGRKIGAFRGLKAHAEVIVRGFMNDDAPPEGVEFVLTGGAEVGVTSVEYSYRGVTLGSFDIGLNTRWEFRKWMAETVDTHTAGYSTPAV